MSPAVKGQGAFSDKRPRGALGGTLQLKAPRDTGRQRWRLSKPTVSGNSRSKGRNFKMITFSSRQETGQTTYKKPILIKSQGVQPFEEKA